MIEFKFLRVLLPGFLLVFFSGLKAQDQIKAANYFTNSTQVRSFLNAGNIVLLSSGNDKEVRIVCSSAEMQKKWEQRLEGSLIFAGNLDGKLLVVVSTDFSGMRGGNNSTYKAFILHPDDGTLITEKEIYKGDNDFLTVPEFFVSKDERTFSLFARETSVRRNVMLGQATNSASGVARKMEFNGSSIRSFNISTYNSKLETIDKIFPVLPQGDFIGAAKTINNDLYVAVSEEKKGVTIAKYLAGEERLAAILFEAYDNSSGLPNEQGGYNFLNLITDTLHNNAVYLTGAIKNNSGTSYIFNKYDFGSNKRSGFRKTFKKVDFKALEKSFIPFNKHYSDLELGSADMVELLSVAFSNENYLVTLGDVHYLPPSQGGILPASYVANGLLVYSLDSNLVERAVSTIPRSYGNFARPSFKSYLKDNSLYLFASDSWRAKFSAVKINAATGKIEDLRLIEPENAGKGQLTDLAEMTVTDKYLILPVKDVKMTLDDKIKYDIHMYRINW